MKKLVVVTGASSGIGREMAKRFSEEGHPLLLLARRLEPMAEFGRNIITRNPEPVKRGKIYEYDQEKADLILAVAEIQNRAERAMPPPKSTFEAIVQHEPYPVESKAREIL